MASKPKLKQANLVKKKKKVNKEIYKDNRNKAKTSSQVIKKDLKNLSLIDKCKLQMSSSLLRLIDESLYSSDSKDVELDKDKFLIYHEAYNSVSEKWPIKPIEYIISFIKKRILVKNRPINKIKFADIGCGRLPLLKLGLPPKANVKSFDLVTTHDSIVEANMRSLPLASESIHCIVYSLSLMASNLGDIFLEGKRILKLGGNMLIVEVTSRFEGQEKKFIGKLEALGMKKKTMTTLKPNGYFTFFQFTKVDSIMDYSESRLNIKLKACVYKTR